MSVSYTVMMSRDWRKTDSFEVVGGGGDVCIGQAEAGRIAADVFDVVSFVQNDHVAARFHVTHATSDGRV